MADKISIALNALNDYLSDLVLSRQERRDFKQLLAELQLNDHEKQVLLASVRDFLLQSEGKYSFDQSIQWFYDITKLIQSGESVETSNQQACFSPGTACRELICNSIRFAEEKIRICVFTISDDEITEELLRAKHFKKDIRIITDNDKSLDDGSDIEQLERAGIPVVMDRTSAHMHHKFALFDDHKILTGSYNWTRSAALYNHENVVELFDTKLFQSFDREFEDLWKELS